MQEEGDTREIRWHIDSLPQHSSSGLDRLVFNQDSTPDVITAVAANDSMLLVARASGAVIRYSLPRIAKEGKYILKCRPQTLAINCNSSKFAAIDMNAVLYLCPTPPHAPPASML